MFAEGSEGKTNLSGNVCSGRYWRSYVPELVLTATAIVLAVGAPWLMRQAEYLGGLRATGVGMSFLVFTGLKPLIGLVLLAVVVLALIRLALRPFTLKYLLLRLLFPIVCLLALCIPIEYPESLAAVYLQGFGRRMSKQVDIGAVQ